MFKFDLQLFAHKKGVGSTRTAVTANPNALVSNAMTALSLKPATSSFASAALTSIRART